MTLSPEPFAGHPEPFACHPERSEGSQGKLREGSKVEILRSACGLPQDDKEEGASQDDKRAAEPKKRVALACDHRGVEMKETIKALLAAKGYGVVDCGTNGPESVDYPDFILAAATKLSEGKCWRAIGICYTGIGSSIVANKVHGVRASLVRSVEEARLTRAHNDSNMLILGAGFLNAGLVQPIVEMWLTTLFEGGRHGERLRKIEDYENTH